MNTIEKLQREISGWADTIFPERTPFDAAVKLVMEEMPEFLTSNMQDPAEYADLVILILDIATLNNINVEEAVIKKMEINRQRTWVFDEVTGTMKHVKKDKTNGPIDD